MLIKTDFSLFSSAITVQKGISASTGTVVLSDNNLFAVLPFVYECRRKNKKPVIGLNKVVGGASYLFIALNKKGYESLLRAESFNSHSDLFKSDNILSIIVEIINPEDIIVKTFYSILSNNEVSNSIISLYSSKTLNTKIINGIEESDFYTAAMIGAVGNQTSFEKSSLTTDFNIDPLDFQELSSLLDSTEDYFEFGDPTPPNFKFRNKFAKEENIYHENITDQELFEHLCKKGLQKRYGNNISKDKIDRLNFEMSVIKTMKFPGYMLIVWDFVNYAKKMGIPVGPGRGSAAGSLVAYSLGITDIDPMKYDLLFERFLNPDRISFPDIDMDFCKDRRGEVIDYVIKAYGRECVAQVITFGKIGGKSAIKDSARALQSSLALSDKISKSIPDKPGMTLKKAFEENPSFWKDFRNDYEIDKILTGAENISGMTRNLGIHAAGLVIGTDPIFTKAPTYNINGVQAIGYDGSYLEDVDLVKFDFLGLKTLTVIDNTIKLANDNINISAINIEDPLVYKNIAKGKTVGLFQIESPGMQDLNKRLQPDRFEDLIAVLALYRPGPMEAGMLDSFINRKRGKEDIDFFFKEMEETLRPILESTYGLIVYQEQVMQIVQSIGGFSLGYSDIIRRAMGKKKDMSVYNKEFSEGAEKLGFNKSNASTLFTLIEKFAGYGFNKSHSAAYALLTFQTAWLKTYYPIEFMTALINSEIDNTEKMAIYIKEAQSMGITVKRPNILESEDLFTIKDNKIVFGLKGIKGVGSGSKAFKDSISSFGCDLRVLLENIQTDPVKEAIKQKKIKEKLQAKITRLTKGIDYSKLQLKKLAERRSIKVSLTESQINSENKHTLNIENSSKLILTLKEELSSLSLLIKRLEERSKNTTFEKLNKRVFISLASVGALDCFGYSRKFLVDSESHLLSPDKLKKFVLDKTYPEFELSEIIQIEESLLCTVFTPLFSDKMLQLEQNEEMPMLALIGKEVKRKKDLKEYINAKFMYPSGEIVTVSDFNKKTDKFNIGDIVSATIRVNGNYKNLQYIKKFNQDNYQVKKVELSLNILDPIPSDLTNVSTIKVFDHDKLVLTLKGAQG